MRSPIERLIDEACGYKPDKYISPKEQRDERVEALLTLADAACAWVESGDPVPGDDLWAAASNLLNYGWKPE